MEIIKRHQVLIKQFILYGIIGSIAAGADSLSFYFLTNYTPVNIYVVNFITIIIGITISFILNTFFNFKVKDKLFTRAVKFYCVGGLGLLLSQAILFIGVEKLMLSSMIVKLFSVFIVAVFQFILNKFITFRSTATNE